MVFLKYQRNIVCDSKYRQTIRVIVIQRSISLTVFACAGGIRGLGGFSPNFYQ